MAYTLTPSPFMQFTTATGVPLVGGKIYSYAAGTTTPLSTYTDHGGTTANTNPVILDVRGEAAIWLSTASYKFVLTDADDVVIWTADNLGGLNISPVFTGVPTAPTAAPGTDTTQLATTAFVQASAATAVPVGVIVIWSGSVASIPAGWLLCNGAYSTPDLRDRFVIGAGNTYLPAASGGSADSALPTHTHAITDPGHLHTQIGYTPGTDTAGGNGSNQRPVRDAYTLNTGSAVTNISLANAGVSATGANLPPFYALCYIIKT
jgi:microcystin-dependent protein